MIDTSFVWIGRVFSCCTIAFFSNLNYFLTFQYNPSIFTVDTFPYLYITSYSESQCVQKKNLTIWSITCFSSQNPLNSGRLQCAYNIEFSWTWLLCISKRTRKFFNFVIFLKTGWLLNCRLMSANFRFSSSSSKK